MECLHLSREPGRPPGELKDLVRLAEQRAGSPPGRIEGLGQVPTDWDEAPPYTWGQRGSHGIDTISS